MIILLLSIVVFILSAVVLFLVYATNQMSRDIACQQTTLEQLNRAIISNCDSILKVQAGTPPKEEDDERVERDNFKN